MSSSNKITVPYITTNKKIKEKTETTKSDVSQSFDITNTTSRVNLLNSYKTPEKTIGKDNSTVRSVEKSYDYSQYELSTDMSLSKIVDKMNDTLHLANTSDTVQKSFNKTTNYYNRFKTSGTNSQLQRGFAHVFFVRPSCNILKESGTKLVSALENHELFSYAFQSSKEILKELVSNNGSTHDFMLSLSNQVASFSLSDEYINSDTYGRTFTGYKVAYGKNNIESKTSGEFSVRFNDNKYLSVYQIHKCWAEYINGVYRGEIAPTNSSIMNKILDYVGSCYYFLTAEDGETIIFWSKYFGVFPTTIPSNQYSWGEGNAIYNPEVEITYKYSFKEDFNPYTMLEFNYNSRIGVNGTNYIPIYDKELGHAGKKWVGTPFVELIESPESDRPYQYKLRFRPD